MFYQKSLMYGSSIDGRLQGSSLVRCGDSFGEERADEMFILFWEEEQTKRKIEAMRVEEVDILDELDDEAEGASASTL